VRPLEGILPPDEITKLAEAMKQAGGLISTRRQPDGTDSPYEINITYFDAMKVTQQGTDEFQIQRFLCSQTIMMSLIGIPAFYIHSLLATHNAYDEVRRTGMNRSINRKKWKSDELFALLRKDCVHSTILNELLRRISVRSSEIRFHPKAVQAMINFGDNILAFSRGKDHELLVFANMKSIQVTIQPIMRCIC
jgi:sucrose phosphorylase